MLCFQEERKRDSAVKRWLDRAKSRVWLGSKWGGWFVTDDMLFMNQHNCLCHFLVWATHSDDTCTHYMEWRTGSFCHFERRGGGSLWTWQPLLCLIGVHCVPQSCWKGGVGKSWIVAEHRSGPGPQPQLALLAPFPWTHKHTHARTHARTHTHTHTHTLTFTHLLHTLLFLFFF